MINCIFCKIINGELPAAFVYKDSEMVAFADINPKAPVHILVVPVIHFESLRDVDSRHEKILGKMMVKVKEIAEKQGISDGGYKIIINNGKGVGQLVFHLHVHILGGWKKSPGWQV